MWGEILALARDRISPAITRILDHLPTSQQHDYPTNCIHVVSTYQSQCHLEMGIHHSLDNGKHISETFSSTQYSFQKVSYHP